MGSLWPHKVGFGHHSGQHPASEASSTGFGEPLGASVWPHVCFVTNSKATWAFLGKLTITENIKRSGKEKKTENKEKEQDDSIAQHWSCIFSQSYKALLAEALKL